MSEDLVLKLVAENLIKSGVEAIYHHDHQDYIEFPNVPALAGMGMDDKYGIEFYNGDPVDGDLIKTVDSDIPYDVAHVPSLVLWTMMEVLGFFLDQLPKSLVQHDLDNRSEYGV